MTNTAKRKTDRAVVIQVIQENGARWPSTFVARREIPKFTGGLFAVGTLANEDSLGTGPRDSFRIGRQVAYSTDSLVKWLISRLED